MVAAAGGSPTTRCSSGARGPLDRGAIECADECEHERDDEQQEQELREGDPAANGEDEKHQDE